MQAFPRSGGGTFQVRPASSPAELREFSRRHYLARLPYARRAVRNHLQSNDIGKRGAPLDRRMHIDISVVTAAPKETLFDQAVNQ
ncbi:hypothetical protein AB0B25_07950 [Nocardia sp. NPDC049190]|uniref:hypothetical protein n=1 Tax=Nocardia sp. NPDC049190 TaxID=3155650 RepID=UPI0033FD1B8B